MTPALHTCTRRAARCAVLQVKPLLAKGSIPDVEVCLSPALPLPEGPPSFGSSLPNKGFQKARRPKRPPTPRGAPAFRASLSGMAHSVRASITLT